MSVSSPDTSKQVGKTYKYSSFVLFRLICFCLALLMLSAVPMNTQLTPGKFVRLKGQPSDLPDFVLERYLGKFCWIRQQAWGNSVQWKVEATRIETEQTRGCADRVVPCVAQTIAFALRS